MIKLCEICHKKIKQGDDEANDALGENEKGEVIFRKAHLNCSIRAGFTEFQKTIIGE